MSITRWKTVGVTVGIVSIVGGSATAYAWPDHSASAAAPFVSSVSAHDVAAAVAAGKTAQLHIAADNAVDWITAITSRLEDTVSAIGSPSTITPREAEHLRMKIRFVEFLQAKAGDLAAGGTAGAAALQTRLAALRSDLSSILANATVVKPFVDTSTNETGGTDPDVDAFDPDRHHCDGQHDRNGQWADGAGFPSYRDHHEYYGHEHRDTWFHH